jgi:hypothetical protein
MENNSDIQVIRICTSADSANKLLAEGWRYLAAVATPQGVHIVVGDTASDS